MPAQLEATPYTRSEAHTGRLNSDETRQLHRRIDALTLRVPRGWAGAFSTALFAPYQRIAKALSVHVVAVSSIRATNTANRASIKVEGRRHVARWVTGTCDCARVREMRDQQAAGSNRRRSLARATIVLLLASIVPSLLSCGQAQVTAVPAGTAVPAVAAAPSVQVYPMPTPARPTPRPASTIAGVPTLAGGVPTKMPTPATMIAAPSVEPDRRPMEKPTPDPNRPAPAFPIVHPDDPYHRIITGTYAPNTKGSTSFATMVIIGTVRQVLPSRWTTPDERRPANPHSNNPYTIYTPVLVEVEQYLKGEQPQRQLLIFVHEGKVGQDQVVYSDRSMRFQEGERVILFLYDRRAEPRANSGRTLWNLTERYTVTPDGIATNIYRTVPLQQLRDEIAAAQR